MELDQNDLLANLMLENRQLKDEIVALEIRLKMVLAAIERSDLEWIDRWRLRQGEAIGTTDVDLLPDWGGNGDG